MQQTAQKIYGDECLHNVEGTIVGVDDIFRLTNQDELSAALMQFASFSTTNFQTFADLSFRFMLTPSVIARTLGFSLVMGLVGGFLPALRASRMNIVDALRAR